MRRFERESTAGGTPTRWSAALGRLRRELDLAILTIFGGVAAIVIAAFSVYRFGTGHVAGGLVDLGITVALGSVVFYAWFGNVARAGGIFIVLAVIACVASSLVLGRTATYWTYLVLSISFVLAGARIALVADLALIVAIAAQPLFDDQPERVIFVVTGLLITVFGWVYNARYDAQRRRLEEMATMDPLTGAGNRRVMSRELAAAVAARRESGAAVAVLDLDHFKEINDEHGHEAGDRVLVALADVVRARMREEDGFYRLGGEEFVVLMPGMKLEQVRELLDAVRRDFEQAMQLTPTPTTVSIGAAAMRGAEDWSDWLKRADEALYRAKQAGRNRVVVDDRA